MSHEHHHHEPANYNRAFGIGIALNLGFVLIEAIFGFRAHSLALLADAGHNLSDVLGLLLAWGAIVLSRRPPTKRRTYGLRRSSILAALANAIFLLIAVGGIGWEAIQRFKAPAHVSAGTVIWVAVAGIIINSVTAILFMSGRKRDMNIEGAFLHMAADAAVSLGVVIAGVVISYTGWYWIDPVVSLIIVAVITIGTWSLLRRSVDLAMDAVPEGIDPVAVRDYLAGLPGVKAIHDLHIWGMSTTEAALTAHLVRPDAKDDDEFLTTIARELHDRFGLEHVTIQVERGSDGNSCKLEGHTAA
ncbi:MAG TPA: cation diffusion facilitator family transporter [Tepidisphaeraceae bacterium]|nr:cation diffusion facilitator family transporter [Tepidisphaeraceae bacterium]